MFSRVPRRYDLLNRLLTLGLDQRWRRRAADICMQSNPGRVMDLCSGTGDLAIELARTARSKIEIIAADFCEPMLEVAEEKAERFGLRGKLLFRVADASALPFDDNYFDAITIGFGFRNLTFKNPKTDVYLKEIYRVIAPGGKLVIVETSQPSSSILKALSGAYYSAIVKPIGNVISGEKGAYSYLAYSARNYFTELQVRELLTDAGYKSVEYHPLMAGVAGIHVATK